MPTVEVQVTSDDYLKVSGAFRRPRGRTIIARLAALFTIGAAGLFLNWWNEPHAAVIVVCAGIGALAGAILMPLIATPRKARRVYTQMAALQRPYQFAWDDQGVTITSEMGHNTIPWREFHKAQELPDLFVLYTSEVSMVMLPKRALPSDDLLSNLRESLYAHVKQVHPARK